MLSNVSSSFQAMLNLQMQQLKTQVAKKMNNIQTTKKTTQTLLEQQRKVAFEHHFSSKEKLYLGTNRATREKKLNNIQAMFKLCSNNIQTKRKPKLEQHSSTT
jgi:hypothetical protein